MPKVGLVGVGICALATLSMTTGCATTKKVRDGTFRAKLAPDLDLRRASVAVVDPYLVGLPGNVQWYQLAFAMAVQSSAKRVLRLAREPDSDINLHSAELSRLMFEAAASGRTSLDPLRIALFESALEHATTTSKLAFLPRYVMLTRIEVHQRNGSHIGYRVTAALYDLRRRSIYAATSFYRHTVVSALLGEVGSLGAQLLSALALA
jgi:hypothetical protein